MKLQQVRKIWWSLFLITWNSKKMETTEKDVRASLEDATNKKEI